MTAVSTADGIKYGFKLMGYQLLVTVVGGGIALVGFFLTSAFGIAAVDNGSTGGGLLAVLIGGVFVLAGVAVWLAGMAGTTYKVVADAVEAGTESASIGRAGATTPGTPQRASGMETRTGRSSDPTGGPSKRTSSSDPSSKGRSAKGRSAKGRSASGQSDRSASNSGSTGGDTRSRTGSSVETARRSADDDRSRSGSSGSGSRDGSSGDRARNESSGDREESSRRGGSSRRGSE
ncbi:hypothetical protein [Haloarchaeobius litoreus]|uniref:Uncharacterized protein n=1 Tax=Haloarchaeobius litoreus TaxID=755306 RepID=A0ABD6DI29_9EURY|nr:hypothetical protein [Haloarchaeobius litoreus]